MKNKLTHIIAITEHDEEEKYSCRVRIQRPNLEEALERVREAIDNAEWDFLHLTGDYDLQHLVSFNPESDTEPNEANEVWNIHNVN